ncbi:MAG: hypothetical protein JO269_09615 [Burkholderiaceae bacterium]|nr:hypothetical protein [Burkholderiaceae bacterium]
MSVFTNGKEAIARFQVMFQGLADAADMLSQFDSLQTHFDELSAQKEILKEETIAAKAELSKIKQDTAAIKKSCDELEQQAQRNFDEKTKEASMTAEKMLAEMRAQADAHRAKAASDVADIERQHAEHHAKAVVTAQAEIDDLNAKAKSLLGQCETAQSTLDSLNAKIDAARATVQKMMGA